MVIKAILMDLSKEINFGGDITDEGNISSEAEGLKIENYGQDEKSLAMNEINAQEEEGVNQMVFDFNAFLEKVDPLAVKPSDITEAEEHISKMEQVNPAEASVMRKAAMDKHIPLIG
jgi:hypothetical protein